MAVVDDPGLVANNLTGRPGAHSPSWIQKATCQNEDLPGRWKTLGSLDARRPT